VRRLLEPLKVAEVGNDLRLPRCAGYRHRSSSFTTSMPSPRIPCEGGSSCSSEVPRSPPPPPVAGGTLVPALSASDAAVAPAPTAALVTSTVEAAGDSITGVSGTLLPNASWLEAFFPLPNVARGTLLMTRRPKQATNRQEKQSHVVSRIADLLGCRFKIRLARLGWSLLLPLV
jgi:hypothetical protein